MKDSVSQPLRGVRHTLYFCGLSWRRCEWVVRWSIDRQVSILTFPGKFSANLKTLKWCKARWLTSLMGLQIQGFAWLAWTETTGAHLIDSGCIRETAPHPTAPHAPLLSCILLAYYAFRKPAAVEHQHLRRAAEDLSYRPTPHTTWFWRSNEHLQYNGNTGMFSPRFCATESTYTFYNILKMTQMSWKICRWLNGHENFTLWVKNATCSF